MAGHRHEGKGRRAGIGLHFPHGAQRILAEHLAEMGQPQIAEMAHDVDQQFLGRAEVVVDDLAFQADLLGVPVVRPKVSETTALGACYLAGLAVGYWGSQAEIAKQWQVDRKFTPAMKPAPRQKLTEAWPPALPRSKQWAPQEK